MAAPQGGITMDAAYCIDCTKTLTPTERYYYGYRCEECEREKFERHMEWLAGGDAPELDELYQGGEII